MVRIQSFIYLVCFLFCVSWSHRAQAKAPTVDKAFLLETEKTFGVAYPEMRFSDASLFPKAYAQGGDLVRQFIDFVFPVSGREKRPPFMSPPFWGVKKPRYKRFDWARFESDHFDFYSYPQAHSNLKKVITYFEEEYERNNRIFGVQNRFEKKIPIVFYQSRRDFEQTSIVDGPIPEGLGGLTEIFGWKRVTFPFEGEKSKFEHVAKHEATHVFQIKKNARRLPLWFIEGSAETNSLFWDSDAEMIIRDAYLNGFFFDIDQLWQIRGTWLMYKIGNYITNLIWNEYGEEGFNQIFENASQMNFDKNIETSLDITLEELNQKVQSRLLLDYGHLLQEKDILDEAIALEEKQVILDAHEAFYISGGAVGAQNALFLNYVKDGVKAKKTLVVDRRFQNESLEYFQKGADLTNSHVVYAIKQSQRDELRVLKYQLQKKNNKIKLSKPDAYQWDHIEKIEHPVMVSDTRIFFIGFQNGFSNIYEADLTTSKLKAITKGEQYYDGLDYCAKDKVFAFSREGNRHPTRISYARHIYTMNAQGETQVITSEAHKVHLWPSFSPDCSKILFSSNRSKTYDLFAYDRAKKQVDQLTHTRVGIKKAHWAGDQTIMFNAYKKMVPSIYKVPYPSRQDVLLRSVKMSKDFSLRIPLFKIDEADKARINEQPKVIDQEPSEDAFHIHKRTSVVYDSGLSYTVEDFAVLDNQIIVQTSEGLPKSSRIRKNRFPHYFEVRDGKGHSLQSDVYARYGLSDEHREALKIAIPGKAIIEGWHVKDGQVFAVSNQRLIRDYHKNKSLSEMGLYIFDPASKNLEALPVGPISKLKQKIQWVSFLPHSKVLIVEATTRQGPYRLIIYDRKKKTYRILKEEAELFSVSPKKNAIMFKSFEYFFVQVDASEGEIQKVPQPKGAIVSAAFLENGDLGIVTSRSKSKIIWTELSTATLKEKNKVEHTYKDTAFRSHFFSIHPKGGIFVTGINEQKVSSINLWDVKGKTWHVLKESPGQFSKPIPRSEHVTFRYKDPQRQVIQTFILHVDKPRKIVAFDKAESAHIAQSRYWITQGKQGLYLTDLLDSNVNLVAQDPMGFDVEGSKIYYSESINGRYAIHTMDMVTLRKEIVKQGTNSDLILPFLEHDELHYLSFQNYRWLLEPDAQDYPLLLSSEKISVEQSDQGDWRYAHVMLPRSQVDQVPMHPDSKGEKKYDFLSRKASQRLKIQSLFGAIAYDGSALRLLASGYADNLFSDRGIFFQGIYFNNTRFGVLGYSDLVRGYNLSAFYNEREGINSYGLNYTKNTILDRYRQWSNYAQFEYQGYEANSSSQNVFVPSSFDGQNYYLLKLGSIYALDITVGDWHGPISGQRLYFKAEAGFDIPTATFANFDLNLDVRLYNRILPRFGLAHRLVAGSSQGNIPNVFLLGGNASFRGVAFDDFFGQNYWVFSEDVRIPIFDFVGAKFFDPLDQVLGFFTRYFDVRGGMYADMGSVWDNSGAHDFKYSVGYFINIPTALGVTIRLHDGLWGEDKFGLWIGTNW